MEKPLTPWQVAYLCFLKSPQWDALRQECYKLANWTCVRCGATQVQLHAHHTIYRQRFEDTQQGDLECLCFKCHGTHHGHIKLPVVPAQPAAEIKTLLDAKLARKDGLITRKEYLTHKRAFKERSLVL